jgi:hypothetical protein
MAKNDDLVIHTKKGIPIYASNPSVPPADAISRYTKAKIGTDKRGLIIDEGSGEILGNGGAIVYEWEEVDKERFVKLFLAGVKQAAGLSKAGILMFEKVYNQVRENPNSDRIMLALRDPAVADVPRATFYRGLRELLEKEFLFRSPWDGTFFVNIRYMFNGDRLAFVKAYHLQGSAPKASTAKKKPLVAGSAM